MSNAETRNFEEFKDDVYRDIRWLEFLDKDFRLKNKNRSSNSGCLGAFVPALIGGMYQFSRGKIRDHKQIVKLTETAIEFLARPEIKKAVCAVLDKSIRLPIDVANAVVPVLYDMPDDKRRIPRDSMLFAIISRRIADKGVENYCK
ncbi:MAG: hypothetical protein ACRD6X_12095 [Pyrinomonadaceae bacterium]